MLSKEEILQKVLSLDASELRSWMNEFPLIEVPIAMDEWAKQEAIYFGDWLNKNFVLIHNINTGGDHWETYGIETNKKHYTTEQLYIEYLKIKANAK